MGYIISKPRNLPRVEPGTCQTCCQKPWLCPSCGDYQCACIPTWLVSGKSAARTIRVHYDREGKPYGPRFIDGYIPPTDAADEDLESIMAEDFAT